MEKTSCILAIDQSTSGTKALLFDAGGRLVHRCDRAHRQIINDQGWVEHDGEEIYQNTLAAVGELLEKTGIDPRRVAAAGISNQRETGIIWDRRGRPLYHAVVWQCARGAALCDELEKQGLGPAIRAKTGLRLSPYFTAAKLDWLIRNVPAIRSAAQAGTMMAGTMDSWLLYRLTGRFRTDYSNASRTQLFNIHTLRWDKELCDWFQVPLSALPEVCDSNSLFGVSTFEGLFPQAIPIHCVLGDSHAALFAQGCTRPGLGKATYGTGSSVMINVGKTPVESDALVTSLAWGMDGRVDYVLEGNINYTGAVINWLRDDIGLLDDPAQVGSIAQSVPDNGGVYLVPAFSGLGAPYWESRAQGLFCGLSRKTQKAHLVRAAEECIAYQITDIVRQVQKAGVPLRELRADGGPTRDAFLMQFQADQLGFPLCASHIPELSGAGAAFGAGLACGLYTPELLAAGRAATQYQPEHPQQAAQWYAGWQRAVRAALAFARDSEI